MTDYEVSITDVKQQLDRGDAFTFIDVRESWEHQTANIEAAKLIPMGEIPMRAHQELDPADHIIVFCHHGMRSLSVVNWLRQQGFENAQSMRGGIDAWSRQIDPKVPVY